jgi:hypothetical protein
LLVGLAGAAFGQTNRPSIGVRSTNDLDSLLGGI